MEQPGQPQQSTRITVTRTIQASPETVFDAFGDSDSLSSWFYRDGQWTTQAANLFKESGEYMFMLFREDGDSQIIQGVYREIVPHQRIVFTWDSDKVQGSIVVVEFRETDGGTEVNLLQEGLVSAEDKKHHQALWTEVLEHLAEFVGG